MQKMPQSSPRTGELNINVHQFADTPKHLSPSPTSKNANHKATNTFDASADNKLGRYLVLGVSVASLFVAIIFLIVAFVEHTHDGTGGRKVPLPWLRSWVKSPAVGPTNRRKHVEGRTLVLNAHSNRVRPNSMYHVDTSLSAEAQNQTIVTKAAIDNDKHHTHAQGKDKKNQMSEKSKEAIGAEWIGQQITTPDKPAKQEKGAGKIAEKGAEDKQFVRTRNHKRTHRHHRPHHQPPPKHNKTTGL